MRLRRIAFLIATTAVAAVLTGPGAAYGPTTAAKVSGAVQPGQKAKRGTWRCSGVSPRRHRVLRERCRPSTDVRREVRRVKKRPIAAPARPASSRP